MENVPIWLFHLDFILLSVILLSSSYSSLQPTTFHCSELFYMKSFIQISNIWKSESIF